MKLIEIVVGEKHWYTESATVGELYKGDIFEFEGARMHLAEFKRLLVYVGTAHFNDKPMVIIASSRPPPFMPRRIAGHNAKPESLTYVGRYPAEKAWEVFEAHRRMM